MYVRPNFKTKKEFIEAWKGGKLIQLYQPGLGPELSRNGTVSVEGPHFPEPHKWYAEVKLKDGRIVKIQ